MKIKNIIFIHLLFLSTLIGGIMSMPMDMLSSGVKTGMSAPLVGGIGDSDTIVDMLTKRNYALQDKLYMYSLIESKDKRESYVSKILAEQSFQLNKDSFISIGGIASYTNNKAKFHIHSLYYDVDFLVNFLNIKIGRGVRNFEYGGHFNIINFLGKNNPIYNAQDMLIKRKSVDGMSVRINNNGDANNYMSMYYYEDDITDTLSKAKYLLEIVTMSKSSQSSIFVNKNENNLSIAVATKNNISENLIFKTSIKYDKNYDKSQAISNSSLLRYYIANNFLIGIDYSAWKSDINIDSKNIKFNYAAYSKFKFGKLKIKAGYIKEGMSKFNLSAWLNIDKFQLYADGFINANKQDEYLARLMLSYSQ